MFEGSTNNTYITPKVEWRSTQNISNNTSSVTATFYLKKSSSSSEATRGTGSWVININGNTKTISKYVTLNANNTYQEIGKHTATVNHNTDGTKDINIKVTGGIPSTSYTSTTCSKNVTLPRIPRNSLLNSVNAVTVNNGSITYNWTVYSGSFNHKLNVRFGSTLLLTFVASGDKAGTYSKTLNLTTAQKNTLFNAMSNSKKVTALFELQTFSGTTQIGSSSNTTADVKVSSASAPTFSGEFTYRDSYPVTAELIEDDKKLVANASVLVVTTPATAAKDGASISKYLVSVGDKTVTSLTGGEIEFGELTTTGKTTITLTAIDTRGYGVVQKRVVEVTPYFPPRFNSWTLRRVNEVEEVVVLSLEGEFSPVIIDGVQRNNLVVWPFNGSLFCSILEGGETVKSYTTYPDFNGTTFTYNGDIDYTFDVNKSYEVKLSVYDRLVKRAEISIAIPKGKPLISLRSGKVGINTAFPQFALDVEGDIGLSGTLPRKKLWSGTLTAGNTVTLSDDLWSYRFVKFKAGTYVTYPLSTVYSGTPQIRAIGGFAGEEHIEIQAIRGTYTKPSDIPTFKLDMMKSFSISTSGITNNATYTNITEIWGIK